MNALVGFLGSHGLMLLAGASALLVAGALAASAQRSPIHRQRLGELSLLCTLLWLVLACVPLPRWIAIKPADSPAAPVGHGSSVLTLSPAEMELVRQIDAGPALARQSRDADVTSSHALDQPAHAATIEGKALGQTQSTPKPIRWDELLAVLYLCGVAGCLGWLVLGHALLIRMLRRAELPEPWVAELFTSVAGENGVRRARLLVSRRPIRPLSCGILRPTVLLGGPVVTPANAQRLRQVFRHELAHLAQHDAWGNALFNLAFPLLYFHPLYWWLRSRTFLARELIADDRAAASSGRVTYAADLISLAKSWRAPRPGPLGVVGMFQFTTDLSRRILMLVQQKEALRTRCSRAWKLGWLGSSAAALAVACGTLGLRPAAAQESDRQAEDVKIATADDLKAADVAADQEDTVLSERGDGEQERLQTKLRDTEEKMKVLQGQLKGIRAKQDLGADVQDAEMQRAAQELKQLGTSRKKLQSLQNHLREGRETRKLLGYADADKPVDRDTRKLDSSLGLLKDDTAPDNAHLGNAERSLDATQAEKDKGDVQSSDKTTADVSDRAATLRDSDIQSQRAVARYRNVLRTDAAVAPADAVVKGLDLVNLANSYADAVGNIQIARAGVNLTSDRERAVAEAKVRQAETKARLLGNIVGVALEQAEQELGRVTQLAKGGAVSQGEVEQAVGRVKILRLILQTGEKVNLKKTNFGAHNGYFKEGEAPRP